MIRTFQVSALVQEFLNDRTSKYPACLLQLNNGNLSIDNSSETISFRMFLLDLQHVSEDTDLNVLDIQSDMLEIAKDFIAEINSSQWQEVKYDWKASSENPIVFAQEVENDIVAGAIMDFSIIVPYVRDTCQVPTDNIGITPNEEDMKLVYDAKYTATGSEGSTLSIPVIVGKKILLVTREYSPLYRVSTNPVSTEFTWDNTNIGLGLPTQANERFLILYREY